MTLNKEDLEMLRRLDGADEKELKQAAYAIATAFGASPIQAKAIAGNLERFRRRARDMTDDELREAASKLSEEQAAEIARLLGIR